jgi:hypothetical protein
MSATPEDERRRLANPSANWQSVNFQWKFLTPIIWAPLLPAIRHLLRGYPQARTYTFAGAILLANLHGIWLINNPDLTDLG